MSIVIILFAVLLICIFVGIPISFSLGIVGIIGAFATSNTAIFTMLPQQVFGGINYYPMLAIPLFVLAGELMNRSQITDRLTRFACVLMGRCPGALAHGNILASLFFGGVTGSAPADSSSIGSVLIPAMVKEGYTPSFSAAVTACSSCLGPIIPPSIIMVMYAASCNTSIGALFAGGYVPGVLICVFQMAVVVMYHFFVQKLPKTDEKLTWKLFLTSLKDASYALVMPIIVVGGIWGGIFTATEAAGVAVIYALIIGLFVTKELHLRDFAPMLKKTVITTSVVMMIVGISKILVMVFAMLRVPQLVSQAFLSVSDSPVIFLLLVNVLLLIMGMFLDAGASVLLIGPILAPIATALGINPIHFGLIMCINLTIGMATPPVGLCLFIVSNIAKTPLEKVSKDALPFIIAGILVLLIVTYCPDVVLFLPRVLGLM